ncbi:MAG TPA: protein kinase [bacterium]|nr:protein kinase [bacterium]
MKYQRLAQKLARRGDFQGAGDLYQDAGAYDKALEMYQKARAYDRTAMLLKRMGRLSDAAAYFVKANQFVKAAELFKQIKEFYKAADMYKRAGFPLLAAEMYDKSGAITDAAIMYERSGNHRRAGELYMERGNFKRGAICLEKELKDLAFKTDSPQVSLQKTRKELTIMLAKAYEEIDRPDLASRYYYQAGEVEKAVEICKQTGDLKTAATYLEKTGQLESAALLYDELGKKHRAGILKIQSLLKDRRYARAARLADELGEYQLAAEAYENAGEYSRAGELYHLANNSRKAIEMFLKTKNWLKASILLEKTGYPARAAELREKIGEREKAAQLYAEAGEPLRASTIFMELGKLEDAIRVLQRAWGAGDRVPSVRNALGLAFLRRGNFELAYDQYLKFLVEESVSPENQETKYELACSFDSRGQYDQAHRIFKELSAYDIDYKDVRDRLDRLAKLLSEEQKGDATTMPHQFAPGRIVANRYVIKEKVGSGGMGEVYRALDRELSNEVALKLLKSKYVHNQEMVQRFKREVTLARKVHHENVVQLYDFEKLENHLYISMEFFHSRDLKAIIRAKKVLKADEIIPIMTQACRGLWAAHRRGIVHRDIKPQNILINDEGIVKLVDFGIATVMESAMETNSEFVVGTPDYMSPEQAKGEPTDPRSDIYSLGTILYEACTGRPPFANTDSFQILVDQVEKPPIPPVEINPDVPMWLNDLILKCMEKEPDDRYDSVQIIERQLATSGIAELMLSAGEEDND